MAQGYVCPRTRCMQGDSIQTNSHATTDPLSFNGKKLHHHQSPLADRVPGHNGRRYRDLLAIPDLRTEPTHQPMRRGASRLAELSGAYHVCHGSVPTVSCCSIFFPPDLYLFKGKKQPSGLMHVMVVIWAVEYRNRREKNEACFKP